MKQAKSEVAHAASFRNGGAILKFGIQEPRCPVEFKEGVWMPKIKIALDVMGGDKGAEMVLPGALLAYERMPSLEYALFGQEEVVRPLLARFPTLEAISSFHPCPVAVAMDEKPSQALRQGRGSSSMWKTLECVKIGGAEAAVSAGNTGALMAMSRLCLGMLPGIDRPAIAALWPTLRGESVVLDVGATTGAEARQLIDFAILGSAMARALFGIERPSVGLLNIGVEEVKGLEEIRKASALLRESTTELFSYAGFVEGDHLGQGTVDVVVTEGFSGNIALKTAEGTARQISTYLRNAMERTLRARIGYFFAKDAFALLREKMDPRKNNGGVFLGLKGIVIKSHGGADAEGFAAAIALAHEMVRNALNEKIAQGFATCHDLFSSPDSQEVGKEGEEGV